MFVGVGEVGSDPVQSIDVKHETEERMSVAGVAQAPKPTDSRTVEIRREMDYSGHIPA